MISTNKLLKWWKNGRRWLLWGERESHPHKLLQVVKLSTCSTSTKAEKGCFLVYLADKKCFRLPLEYLNNEIIRELFKMVEEEFKLPSKGPLSLACITELMEYIISLIKNFYKWFIFNAIHNKRTKCMLAQEAVCMKVSSSNNVSKLNRSSNSVVALDLLMWL